MTDITVVCRVLDAYGSLYQGDITMIYPSGPVTVNPDQDGSFSFVLESDPILDMAYRLEAPDFGISYNFVIPAGTEKDTRQLLDMLPPQNDKRLHFAYSLKPFEFPVVIPDLDYGDIEVTGEGTIWTISADVATVIGRAVMGATVAADGQTALELVPGIDVQAHSAVLDEYASINPTVLAGTILVAATGADVRALIGTVIGVDVQQYDADLATIAGMTGSDVVPYRQPLSAGWATTAFTPLARTLVGNTTALGMRNTLLSLGIQPRATSISASVGVIDVTATAPTELALVDNGWGGGATKTFTTTGTPAEGQDLWIRLEPSSVVKTLVFGSTFASTTAYTMPASTISSKQTLLHFKYNATLAVFQLVMVTNQP